MAAISRLPTKIRMSERGVEFKGGSLHDGFGGFDGFSGSGEHLALFLLCPRKYSTMRQPWRF